MNTKKMVSGIIFMALLTISSVNTYAFGNEINNVGNRTFIVAKDDVYFDKTAALDEDEFLKLYNRFLISKNNSTFEETDDLARTLDEFAQYAVDNGVIEDTPVQRAAITKALVRREFKTLANYAYVAGYRTAANFLNHSLQDNPSDLTFGSDTTYSAQVLGSSECEKIISDFKEEVKGKNHPGWTMVGSTTLNSTNDLHLAYNRVNYVASGQNKNGNWTLIITFRDTYDFESQAWKNIMTDNAAVVILNNYAAYAQSIGAIVPYDIRVIVKTTFTE